MNQFTAAVAASRHQLCFKPVAGTARAFAFRCDAAGRADLDALGRRERLDDLYARALVGRDFVRRCVVALPGARQ